MTIDSNARALMSPIHHAEWLISLGVKGVADRALSEGCDLPDREAAIRGAFALIHEDRLNAEDAARIVAALWGLWTPRPTARVAPEVWRKLWSISGPTIDDDSWAVPESLSLYRGARDETSARGWSWTTEPAIARFHAEGLSPTNGSGRRHSSPRIFRTVAPREALFASVPCGGEAEIIVDPELLDEITEVPRDEWKATIPKPITIRTPDGRIANAPCVSPWTLMERAEAPRNSTMSHGPGKRSKGKRKH